MKFLANITAVLLAINIALLEEGLAGWTAPKEIDLLSKKDEFLFVGLFSIVTVYCSLLFAGVCYSSFVKKELDEPGNISKTATSREECNQTQPVIPIRP